MNLSGNTFVAIAADGRLFGLDPQLLFDAAVTAVNVFVLFLLLTFILFNPVRNMLKKRQDKITSDRENAENGHACRYMDKHHNHRYEPDARSRSHHPADGLT